MTYGYLRVSSDKQDMESQKIGVVKKSEELRLAIKEWITDDGVSGTKEYKERELGILMEKLKDGDIVIVSEISRLARSVFMLFRIVEYCTQTKDCQIISVKENQTLKKNDSISAIILSSYGTAAQIEREMIVKRTIEGLERRRKAGVILGRPVGSKDRKKNKKYESLKKQVQDLFAKGISYTGVSRITGLHRSSLARLVARYNISYDKKRCRNKSDYMKKILVEKMPLLTEMAANGKTMKEIHSLLNEGSEREISLTSISDFIRGSYPLYNLMINKNQEMRAVRNADCGRVRRYCKF